MKKFYTLLMLSGLFIVLFSCKKDKEDETKEEEFTFSEEDLTPTPIVFEKLDGSKVSSVITIANSTRKSGNPPAPTSEIEAPKIDEYDDNTRVASGKNVVINPYVTNGDGSIAGFYIKISGSSDYFDVKLPSSSSARKGFSNTTKKSNFSPLTRSSRIVSAPENSFEIQIPSSITTGEFCTSYCVYDTAGRISNIVEKCVQVQSFGGAGSEFLIGKWNFEKVVFADFIDGKSEVKTIKLGESDNEEIEDEYLCEDGSITKYTEEFTINSFWLNLTSNGGMAYAIKSIERDLNYSLSSCQNPVFETYEDLENETGAWSYDQTTKNFTLLIEGKYYSNEFGEYYDEPYFMDFKANKQNGNLILSFSDDDIGGNSNIVYYFKK